MKLKRDLQLELIFKMPTDLWNMQADINQGKRIKQPVQRKIAIGCIPLPVWLIHHNNEWYIHQSFMKDKEVAAHTQQNRVGRAISDLSKAMAAFFRKESWIPICGEISDPIEDNDKNAGPWHAVVTVSKRRDKIPQCSTLSA